MSAAEPPRGFLARFDRLWGYLEAVLNFAAGAVVFAMMLFVCGELVARGAFNRPIFGFIDVVEQAMAAVAFLGAAYCQRLGGHVRMDMAVGMLHGRRLWVAELTSTAVAMVVIGLLIRGSWQHFLRAYTLGDTTIDAELTTWPSKLIAPGGLSILWLRLLVQLIGYARLVRRPETEPIAIAPLPGAHRAHD
jgi:TRAP-type C4-dicarboxylate transport system permease small subunit